jgi:hypothetical protein
MAQTNVMDVQVKQLTKYGFQNDKDEYIGWSKNIKDADKSQVVPGRKFSVEMYIADSGKQYVNKVLRQLDAVASVPAKAVTSTLTGVTVEQIQKVKAMTSSAKSSDTMTKAEWSAKDRSQLIGGLSHDAATLAAALLPMSPDNTPEDVLVTYKQLLEGMLKIRDEVR